MSVAAAAPATQTLFPRQSAGRAASTADDVFWQIWMWITEDRGSSGARVTEIALAERFHVSRTPLRDAVQRLVAMGLMQRRMNRTLTVTPMSLDDMEALSRTRECLEGMVAKQVAERYAFGEIDIDSLESLNERMRRLADIDDTELLLDTGRAFHDEMMRLSGNAYATKILSEIMLCLERYRRLVLDETSRGSSIVSEHESLLTALRDKDGAAAERHMRQHISDARGFYRKILPRILGEDTSGAPDVSNQNLEQGARIR